VFVAICTVMNTTISSSSAGGASRPMSDKLSVHSTEQLILPTSIYLVGYTFGPLIFGPLSESFGRKPAMIAAFAMYTVFSVATALSPNFTALVIFRLLAGVAGACPIAVVGG
jgi:MFS family permease